MKVRIKRYRGNLEALSTGKVYEVLEVLDDDLVRILDDVGDSRIVHLPCCSHLKGGSWEVVQC